MSFRRGVFRLWLLASSLWVLALVVYVEAEGRRRNDGSFFLNGWVLIADGWEAEREVATREAASVVPDDTRSRIAIGKDVQRVALIFAGMLFGPPLLLLVFGAWVIRG
ncbi:hypothetical protein [Ensifer sp. BR816]|uniref:hypothetical protein n=1 Tax=Rhizobium sp. (strain BR816) TaxID=1057002 RepID=UPI00037005AA|nr:hypothetical protein [Ensifer sp. BR816]